MGIASDKPGLSCASAKRAWAQVWLAALGLLAALIAAPCFAQQVRLEANGLVGVLPTSATGTSAREVSLGYDAPLGRYASLLDETPGHPLTLDQAREQFARGAFRRTDRSVPNFGNGAPPMWLHLTIDNPQPATRGYRIYVAQNWADKVDARLIAPDGHIAAWQAGIDRAPARYLRPGLGYGFDAELAPGRSQLFIRADSVDSVAFALRIVPVTLSSQLENGPRGWIGVVQGYLLALVVTFGLLWLALGETSLLRYVAYVGSYLYMYFAYSGIAALNWWPDSPYIARYAILVGMVLFSSAGIWFAREFLDLAAWKPRLDRAIAWLVRIVLLAMALCIVGDFRAVAVHIAFNYILLFTLLMVGLGLLAAYRHRDQAWFFLGASLASMLGAFTTTLAVMGKLPFSDWTFHAVEVGVMVEASTWALALGLRLQRDRRHHAQTLQLAEHDALTGLYNRRGLGHVLASLARAHGPDFGTAIAMLDIDHFKAINDHLGHNAGDRTLVAVADLLRSLTRKTDAIARWGGEEFIVLMPQTPLDEAITIAERIRAELAGLAVPVEAGGEVQLTVSIGVANLPGPLELTQLLHRADAALYKAKQAGRNRVATGSMQPAAGASAGN